MTWPLAIVLILGLPIALGLASALIDAGEGIKARGRARQIKALNDAGVFIPEELQK